MNKPLMPTRRSVISGVVMTAAGPLVIPRNVSMALAQNAPSSNNVVVVFQRGACDGLNFISPVFDTDYLANRPNVRLQSTGTTAAINIGAGLGNTEFRLHPNATGLAQLFANGNLALFQAAGLLSSNRSHFKSYDMMERGYADNERVPTNGWLTRMAQAVGATSGFGSLSTTAALPISMLLLNSAMAITSFDTFTVRDEAINRPLLGTLYGSNTGHGQVGQSLMGAIQNLSASYPVQANGRRSAYVPTAGVTYPNTDVGNGLKTVAQALKLNLGVKIATVDQGGWDTHNQQLNRMGTLVTSLSNSLVAFWNDLGSTLQATTTVIVMTEFGRRVRENGSQGTDHGHGSTMMVLGAGVRGGMYGVWPGLQSRNLDQGLDLQITTDYRQVAYEVFSRRFALTSPVGVFDTLRPTPLGFMA